MIATKITEMLSSMYSSESGIRSVLLNGKYGCGKTYNIGNFVNGELHPNVIYLSLFGAKSKNDIVIKLAEKLDSSFIYNLNGNYSISFSLNERPYNGCMIIFDDIDRKEDCLSYTSVFGIVDSLCKLGFKTVCVVNSDNVKTTDEYRKLLEKTFDTIIHVSPDSSIFSNILPDIESVNSDKLLSDAKENWRTIIKAKNCYDNIISFMGKNEKGNFLSVLQMNHDTFFYHVLIAITCIFSVNEEMPNFNKDDFFKRKQYEYYVEQFGENTANKLLTIISSDDKKYKISGDLLETLILCLTEGNYQSMIDKYYPSKNGILSNEPFCWEPFFLDDNEKEKLKSQFFKRLKEFDFAKDNQAQYLNRILSVFFETMSENEISMLTNRILETVPFETHEDFTRKILIDNQEKQKNLKSFIDSLNKSFQETNKEKIKNLLDEAFEKKDYSILTDFLWKNEHKESHFIEYIANIFRSHGFALPNLSKTISYDSWEYCHEIAHFVAKLEQCKMAFIEELKKQCKQSESTSLRERCNALVFYNFNLSLNFFELYPLKP